MQCFLPMGGSDCLESCHDCDKAGIWEKIQSHMIGCGLSKRLYSLKIVRNSKRDGKKSVWASAKEKLLLLSFRVKKIAQENRFSLNIRGHRITPGGGQGGACVRKARGFEHLLVAGLQASPVHEVAYRAQSIMGWKEYESLKVKCVITSVKHDRWLFYWELWSMGVGITGDSITVAPAMTLPD